MPKLLRELQKLKHKNIMEIFYWFTDASGSIIIVSPFYEGHTLLEFVKKIERPLEDCIIYKIFG